MRKLKLRNFIGEGTTSQLERIPAIAVEEVVNLAINPNSPARDLREIVYADGNLGSSTGRKPFAPVETLAHLTKQSDIATAIVENEKKTELNGGQRGRERSQKRDNVILLNQELAGPEVSDARPFVNGKGSAQDDEVGNSPNSATLHGVAARIVHYVCGNGKVF